jgi:hypothetical protein
VSAKNIPLKPVVVTSTVTPALGTFTSDEGSLAVTVTGADGTGRAGVNVSITGPGNDVQLTDANGCAFFGYEPIGGYNVTATASNYVDPNGNLQATGATSIGSQSVATLPLSYDNAGAVTANFKTTPDNTTTAQDTKQGSLGVSNSGMTTSGGVRYFGNGTPVTSLTTPQTLYPFPAAYGLFAGDCANNAAPTGVTPDSIIVPPGRTDLVKDVTVPALNVVTQINGANKPSMYVRIKSTTAGCTPTTYPARTSNANFRLDDPGFPYGTYSVCVDNRFQASIATARSVTSTVTLNTPTSAAKVFNVLTSASQSACT